MKMEHLKHACFSTFHAAKTSDFMQEISSDNIEEFATTWNMHEIGQIPYMKHA